MNRASSLKQLKLRSDLQPADAAALICRSIAPDVTMTNAVHRKLLRPITPISSTKSDSILPLNVINQRPLTCRICNIKASLWCDDCSCAYCVHCWPSDPSHCELDSIIKLNEEDYSDLTVIAPSDTSSSESLRNTINRLSRTRQDIMLSTNKSSMKLHESWKMSRSHASPVKRRNDNDVAADENVVTDESDAARVMCEISTSSLPQIASHHHHGQGELFKSIKIMSDDSASSATSSASVAASTMIQDSLGLVGQHRTRKFCKTYSCKAILVPCQNGRMSGNSDNARQLKCFKGKILHLKRKANI